MVWVKKEYQRSHVMSVKNSGQANPQMTVWGHAEITGISNRHKIEKAICTV